jgi:hypothetical protein
VNRALRVLTRPWVACLLIGGIVATGAGLYWFQPWKLWVSENVDEALPAAAAPPNASSSPSVLPSKQPGTPDSAAPRTVASGELISHEHSTTGSVRVVRLPDGSHVLRLENLETSNGPDLRVWLTDAPVKPGKDGWHVFDDGNHVSLGKLKGNKGNQNYGLPDGIGLSRYTSVSIWCDRFDVSFGAAELTRA